MKALLALLGIAAVGGFIYSRQAKAAQGEAPSSDTPPPEFTVTGDSGTAWQVKALGVDVGSAGEELALFMVLLGATPILQYAQYPGQNDTRVLAAVMTNQSDPYITLAMDDFGIVPVLA